jgi:hypothetical protein
MVRCWFSLLVLFLAVSGSVRAEQVRFLFVPADASGSMQQVPAGPDGALGEQIVGLGLAPRPYAKMLQPTHMVTFRHPYTGGNVTVPLKLPASTPRMEHRSDRIIYNYGSYTVEARFLRDGAVETRYNSGFLRPLGS